MARFVKVRFNGLTQPTNDNNDIDDANDNDDVINVNLKY